MRDYAYRTVQVIDETARSWRVIIDGKTRWLAKIAVRTRLSVGYRGSALVYLRAIEG